MEDSRKDSQSLNHVLLQSNQAIHGYVLDEQNVILVVPFVVTQLKDAEVTITNSISLGLTHQFNFIFIMYFYWYVIAYAFDE